MIERITLILGEIRDSFNEFNWKDLIPAIPGIFVLLSAIAAWRGIIQTKKTLKNNHFSNLLNMRYSYEMVQSMLTLINLQENHPTDFASVFIEQTRPTIKNHALEKSRRCIKQLCKQVQVQRKRKQISRKDVLELADEAFVEFFFDTLYPIECLIGDYTAERRKIPKETSSHGTFDPVEIFFVRLLKSRYSHIISKLSLHNLPNL